MDSPLPEMMGQETAVEDLVAMATGTDQMMDLGLAMAMAVGNKMATQTRRPMGLQNGGAER